MKKILLVDVDSKIPNIALGKLSTYHKSLGDKVDYINLSLKGFSRNVRTRILDACNYNRVYASNIFTVNQKKFKIINCDDVRIGGVGSVNNLERLPVSIDRLNVDYSLWPDNDKSYGFITRGCIRKCKFCFVPRIEGKIRFETPIDKIVKHKIVIFLDNNILGYPEHKSILQELADKQIRCQFNQGLDIRLIDDENAKLLSKIPYYKKYLFAFDDIHYKDLVEKGIEIFQKYVSVKWMMKFLVYYSANNPLHDLIYRVEWLKERNTSIHVMRDINCMSSIFRTFLIEYTSYVGGSRGLFYKLSFSDYLEWRNFKYKDRVKEVLNIYNKALKGEI